MYISLFALLKYRFIYLFRYIFTTKFRNFEMDLEIKLDVETEKPPETVNLSHNFLE